MSRAPGLRPPPLWLALARMVIAAGRREEIEGDLIELWQIRVSQGRSPRRPFWRDLVSVALRGRGPSRAPRRPHEPRRRADAAQDVRYAVRLLRRYPAFSSLAIATLTVGIAASTAIFTVAERVLLRPLPYPDLDRVVRFPAGIEHGPWGVRVSDDQASLPQLSAVGLYAGGGLNLGEGPEPIRLRAAAASAGFFATLGVPAMIGRTFTPEEDKMAKVAILSFDLWRRHFGSDTSILGRTIRLDSQPFEVIGVMPPGFSFPAKPEVLVPPYSDRQMTGSAFTGTVIGRLAPRVTREQLASVLQTMAERESHGEPVRPVEVTPLTELLAATPRPTLLFLALLSGMLLLVACANVAGVLMARLRARERELVVRRALGATRGRLLRQLLTECAVLTSIAAVLAMSLAYVLVRAFAGADAGLFPDLDLARIDARFFVIGATLSAIASAAFALGPAISAGRAAFLRAPRETATASRWSRAAGSSLVVGQVALAIVLLAAAGAATASVVRLMRVDIGYHNASGLFFEVTLPSARYRNSAATLAFVKQFEERVRAIPGVRHVGASNITPGGKGVLLAAPLALEGDPNAKDREWRDGGTIRVAPAPRATFAPILAATPGYFAAMGIPVVAGRTFNDQDGGPGRRAVILSEGSARAISPDIHSLIGRRLARTAREEPAEIVGIVGNIRLWDVKNDATRASYQLYEPVGQAYPRGTVGIAVDPGPRVQATLAAVRETLRALDGELPVYNIERVADLQARYLATERLTLALAGSFSLVALVLCAIGLYGTLAQVVTQRTRELGIRLALGADRQRLLRSVLWQGLRLAVAGIVAGSLAAIAAARVASRVIPMFERPDAATLAVNAAVLLAVALLATWVPARRASAVDPAAALRSE